MTKSNYQAGHDAEKIAAQYLKTNGYKIIELNWKTPRCEIDIVASKFSTIFFVV
jgi:Holliday junction resolvase-like predicted endonuclease